MGGGISIDAHALGDAGTQKCKFFGRAMCTAQRTQHFTNYIGTGSACCMCAVEGDQADRSRSAFWCAFRRLHTASEGAQVCLSRCRISGGGGGEVHVL